jgi:hypothetical protein
MAPPAGRLQERLGLGPAWTDTGLIFTREDGQVLHPKGSWVLGLMGLGACIPMVKVGGCAPPAGGR